jgi:hypothetical protein
VAATENLFSACGSRKRLNRLCHHVIFCLVAGVFHSSRLVSRNACSIEAVNVVEDNFYTFFLLYLYSCFALFHTLLSVSLATRSTQLYIWEKCSRRFQFRKFSIEWPNCRRKLRAKTNKSKSKQIVLIVLTRTNRAPQIWFLFVVFSHSDESSRVWEKLEKPVKQQQQQRHHQPVFREEKPVNNLANKNIVYMCIKSSVSDRLPSLSVIPCCATLIIHTLYHIVH